METRWGKGKKVRESRIIRGFQFALEKAVEIALLDKRKRGWISEKKIVIPLGQIFRG